MTQPNLLPSGLPRIESLEMRGIVKRFPGVLANDHVDFDVKAGEVHALLGENGAGKSTLMKILYGLYQPDEGEILLNSRPIRIHSPTDSISHGIGMIHQHFMLVDNLTVAENVALGLRSSREPRLDLDVVRARIRELADSYGLQVDPDATVSELAVGQQQRVEIVKALYRGAALLVLDEPTAVLTPQEVDDLFLIFKQMAADGHALIFISHKLHEIFALTDRVTVLRDGQVVGTRPTRDVTKEDLASMMVGREVLLERKRPPATLGQIRLKLDNVTAVNNRGGPILKNVSFEVRGGEIVGVAGVSGNGQKPLAEAIAGLLGVTSGSITLEGRDVTGLAPAQMIDAGLSYIPEERMHDGAIKEFSVEENFILQDHVRKPYTRGIFLDFKTIAREAQEAIRNFKVKTPSKDTPLKNLSGGNIQKLILARELARRPRVLIAAQPTRGVDIGATEYIHNQLLQQRAQGLATLLISEDLDEVRALSDRIIVMYGGEIMGIVHSDEATVEQLGLMMAGERRAAIDQGTPAR
ncbi:MAG TPA: ABC transporter ATP-binding protein [Anaerolineae bacterium]|nr:ABC transporter ATP-binding protein [Anaerolineae bacterium]HMR67507.1 ABC transporter ATP-binding protein [Anaerolineae bacterium]